MTDLVQYKAIVKLGTGPDTLTDYSCWISSFVINEARAATVKAPSFGSPVFEDMMGAHRQSVTMTFLAVPHGSSGLWFAMWTAAQTRTGELYFDVKYADAAVSVSNPKRTGYIKVSDLDMGAAAYRPRVQSKTFPARGISAPLSSE